MQRKPGLLRRYARAREPIPEAFIAFLNKRHRRTEGAVTPEDWKVVQAWHAQGDFNHTGQWMCLCGQAFGNNLQADIHISQGRSGQARDGHRLVWWCAEHMAPEQGPENPVETHA